MRLNTQCTIEARYGIKVEDSTTGEVAFDSNFSNLITDTGLDLIGSLPGASGSPANKGAHVLGSFVMGSGSRTPSFNDVALESPIKWSGTGGESATQVLVNNGTDLYIEQTFTRTFTQGFWEGNFSEIGRQHASITGALFSRALILDGDGLPTTLTLLSSDIVTLEYTIRIHYPTEDIVTEFNIIKDGVVTPATATIRPAELNTNLGVDAAINQSSRTLYGYSGTLGAVTSAPSGTRINATVTTSPLPYSAGSHTRTTILRAPIAGLNGTSKCLLWMVSYLGSWQCELSVPITKDDTQILDLEVGLSWGRHV